MSDVDSIFSSQCDDVVDPRDASVKGSSTSSDDDSEDKSRSFTCEGDRKPEEEFNLNVSFTGGYVPNTDLTRVDKG